MKRKINRLFLFWRSGQILMNNCNYYRRAGTKYGGFENYNRFFSQSTCRYQKEFWRISLIPINVAIVVSSNNVMAVSLRSFAILRRKYLALVQIRAYLTRRRTCYPNIFFRLSESRSQISPFSFAGWIQRWLTSPNRAKVLFLYDAAFPFRVFGQIPGLQQDLLDRSQDCWPIVQSRALRSPVMWS